MNFIKLKIYGFTSPRTEDFDLNNRSKIKMITVFWYKLTKNEKWENLKIKLNNIIVKVSWLLKFLAITFKPFEHLNILNLIHGDCLYLFKAYKRHCL